MELRFSRHIFEKCQKNRLSWKSDQLRQRGSMRTDGRTDGRPEMMKLTVAFRNFANGPKSFRVADGNGTHILYPICSFVRLMFYKPFYTDILRIHASDPHLQEMVNELTDSHENWHGCHSTKGTPPINVVLTRVKSTWQARVNSTLRVTQHS